VQECPDGSFVSRVPPECNFAPCPTEAPTEAPLGTIVDIAAGNPDFSTLVSLLEQAGLVNTLNGPGPFTVFAPTNAAFAALPQEVLDAVASDTELLTQVLLYHVVDGLVESGDLVDGASVPTFNGADVTTFTDPFMVNDANIIAADVIASNGVIHAIDAVLIPPTPTGAPVAPTEAPVAITDAPVVAPTEAPVAITDAPVVAPTEAPVAITDAPVVAPTEAPVAITDAPVAPTEAPVAGTPAPVATTDAPTTTPVASNVRDIVSTVALQGGAEWADTANYAAKAITWLESDPLANGGTLSDVQIQQRYALGCIYFATFAVQTIYTVVEPRGWIDSTGWITEADECTWFGLSCNAEGLVERIVLASNRLTGSFPPETTIMAGSVTRIDLFRNSVFNTGDEGNAWLGQMTNLRELFYGQTNFEFNGIPPQIAQLTNLIEYDCSFTLYFGPLNGATFAPLQNLEYLVLSGNAYNTSIPVEIGQLPNLRTYTLLFCSSEPPLLLHATSKSLMVAFIFPLCTLEFFYAQNAFVDGDLSFMLPMQSIIECWVDQNPGLGGTIPTEMGLVRTLQSWSITRCGFTGPIPSEIGNLGDMVRMWVYDNMLTGTVPAELGNMFKLQTFEMEENLLTGVMPEGICMNRVPNGLLATLEADCGGTPPEIECTCCTCCEQCLPALARTMVNGEEEETLPGFLNRRRQLHLTSV